MGRVFSVKDFTGGMSPDELNAENIRQLSEELNRNSDQLDAIANGLNIIGRGSKTATWDGTGGLGGGIQVLRPHGFTVAPIFMATYVRSDDPTNWYPAPNWTFDSAGALVSRVYCSTDATYLFLSFDSVLPGTPVDFTFSWYLLQQPAQLPSS